MGDADWDLPDLSTPYPRGSLPFSFTDAGDVFTSSFTS